MAITFVSASNTTYGSRTNTTITAPSGIADGDELRAAIITAGSGEATNPTAPAGWTEIGTSSDISDGTSFNLEMRFYRKRASGESGNYTWTHSSASSQGAIAVFRGVDATTPDDATATLNSSSPATTTRTWTGLTTVTDGAWLLAWGHDWADTSNALSPPSGMTERIEVNPLIYLATEERATAGATGNRTHTCNSAANFPRTGALFALRPAAGGGGVEGSITGTIGDTASATGALAITGSIAGTAGDTAAATGALAISGAISGAITDTAAITGALAITGSIAGTLGDTAAATGSLTDGAGGAIAGTIGDTVAATGALAISGSAAGTVVDTAAATGALAITGTVSGTVGDTAAATATISRGPGGAIAGTIGDSVLATGAIAITGAVSATVGDTASIAGALAISGVVAGTVGDTASATGALTDGAGGAIVGTIGDAVSATGALAISGAVSGTVGDNVFAFGGRGAVGFINAPAPGDVVVAFGAGPRRRMGRAGSPAALQAANRPAAIQREMRR